MPTPEELEEERSNAEASLEDGGTNWPGMSYEEGVSAALAWVLGDRDERPMED